MTTGTTWDAATASTTATTADTTVTRTWSQSVEGITHLTPTEF
jgi:hypothetical protein